MKYDETHKSGISAYRGHNSIRGYSSVVEHLTADQEVPGSNPGAPCFFFLLFFLAVSLKDWI